MLLYFVDNDIIIELASYNLFWEMIASLQASQKDFRVLPTASSYIDGSSKLRRKYKQESLQFGKRIADSIQVIDHNLIDQSELLSLNLEGIDSGEALLVAATKGEDNAYLLTCDKRFLKTLSKSNLNIIKERLSKKIICLEQLLINLINNNDDFDKIRRRIIASDLQNQNIFETFKNGKLTTKEQALQILEEFTKELRQQTGDLLVDSLPVK
ncbi:MAG TPA: hypothetical protein VK184_04595 [Nostocaceae cyanobacterium]|nr:hypothetical protein [Nostocaceae cyanobacterium]